ncbi:50S ribosomal protein L18a [Candidatus Micrarchaeota archaeon]|nr:50S ribosomal protein L18a [Candidatus Micrarchaeota archaeon]
MAVFNVSGRITLGTEERAFTKQVEAETENAAKHRAYAYFGSQNGVKRNKIKIEKVEKVS